MNYKITCPNKKYNGESASVKFINGVGNTDSEYLAGWFRSHGYGVEEVQKAENPQTPEPPQDPENPKTDDGGEKANRSELMKKCKELGIPTEKTDTVESLKAKIDSFEATNKDGGANE